MKLLLVLLTIALATAGFAQNKHSVQVDDGLGAYSYINAPSVGGTFTLPNGGGMLLTSNGGTSSPAWLVGGNTTPSSTLIGNNTALGDLDLRAGNATRLSLNGTTGAVTIAGAVFGVNGVSYTFPAANAVGVMTNNGSGTVTWTPVSPGWSLSGNALIGALPGSPIEFFGSTNGADVVMQTNGVEQMRLLSSGGVLLPVTAATGVGVIYQGSYPLIHTFGVGDFFAGRNAGNFVMSGGSNTAIGDFVFRANTSGSGNTGVGTMTLLGNTQGSNNTASGAFTLLFNTTGGSNTVSGYGAMQSNTTASQNVAIGNNALFTQSFSNGGVPWNTNNTAVGFEALYSNQPTSTVNGLLNTAMGYQSLRANTTGFNNTASGGSALTANTIGANNTALGSFTLWKNTTASGNTALGAGALQLNTTGDDNTASGISALSSNTIGTSNTASGKSALQNNTTASQNVAIGNLALLLQSYSNGGVAWSSNNTAVGFEALRNNQPTTTSNAVSNTATGFQALRANTTGSLNTASGATALLNNTTGAANTASGFQSLNANLTGGSNTASGYQSLRANISGGTNTATGTGALVSNTSGSLNTASGGNALQTNTIGSLNTAIGYLADVSTNALANATAIGANATVNASNKIQLGDVNVTSVSTYGSLSIRNIDYVWPAAAGAGVLTSDGAGNLSWAAAGGVTGTGTTNAISKWTSATALGNSALTDNGTTLSYNFFSLTSGQITTLGASFSNSSSNGRIVAITNNDASGGGGNSRGLDITMPNAPIATGTATGLKFSIASGVGISYDILGTAGNWKVTSAGSAILTGLGGANANKYAEQHTVAAGEIAGNVASIGNSVVAGATSVVVATLVSNGAGGTATMVKRVVAGAGSVSITFDNAPVAGDVVNYIVVNP